MSDLTSTFWNRYRALRFDHLDEDVRTVASHCVLDWFGCALAGSREPLAEILLAECGGAPGNAAILGTAKRAAPTQAALINGAAGHALDYDDTHPVMGGHSTVPVLPAALAAAQDLGKSGAELLTAFVVGVEFESQLGRAIGPEHYAKGWHVTSTIGVFGAAAAVAHLLDLDEKRFGYAVGLAASQASGVKANFGTMTKPFHAGNAAERGLLAARLASRGFTANDDAFAGAQGLVEAAGAGSTVEQGTDYTDDGRLILETLFKYHAACYLTHAAIEATGKLRGDIAVDQVESVEVTVHPALLDVCAIAEPKTGLEAKFSLAATIALTLLGDDTTAPETFNDARIAEPEVQGLIARVRVSPTAEVGPLQSRLRVATRDEQMHEAEADTGTPASDLARQGRRLHAKYMGLAKPVLGRRAEELAASLGDLPRVPNVAELPLAP